MKRIVVFFVLSLLAMSTNAKIKSSILGCVLGLSDKCAIELALKSRNIDYSFCDDCYCGYDVAFAGYTWKCVRIKIYKEVFAEITFEMHFSNDLYENIREKLLLQYDEYKYTFFDEEPYFSDGRTIIMLLKNELLNTFSLSYCDNDYLDKIREDNDTLF